MYEIIRMKSILVFKSSVFDGSVGGRCKLETTRNEGIRSHCEQLVNCIVFKPQMKRREEGDELCGKKKKKKEHESNKGETYHVGLSIL